MSQFRDDELAGPGGRSGQHVVVVGLGVSGQSVVSVLASRGVTVTALDSRADSERQDLAERVARQGVQVRLGPAALGPDASLP
ncbi:MAG: hypothetical protein WBH47_11835, partial [Streptosporangiaceae bacterium]